jgi:hypothetical protein
MNRKRSIAIALAALAMAVPEVAHAYSVEGLYAYLALSLGLPALLSLVGGVAVTSYLRAVAVAVVVGTGAIAVWSHNTGVARLDLFHIYFVAALVLVALVAHALRRYWLSPRRRGEL